MALVAALVACSATAVVSTPCTTSVRVSARVTASRDVRIDAVLVPGSGDDACFLYGAVRDDRSGG